MRRIAASLAAVLLCAAALVACGDDTSTTTTAAAGGNVVTIGFVGPIEGGLTDFGLGIRNSVELAVMQANANNAVPGWTLQVKSLDDSSDPDKGASQVAAMVDDPTVVAMVAPYNSGVSAAMLPALAGADLALVSSSNTLASLTVGDDSLNPTRQYPNYFRLVGSDAQQGEFLAEQALALGYSTAAVVSETKAVSKGLADVFASAFAANGGTVTVTQVVPDGATDFADFIAAAGDPDVIFFGGEYPVAATLAMQATAAGLTVPVMGGDGIKDDAFITQAEAASEGTLASSVGVPAEELTTAADFFAAYEAAGFAEPPSPYGPYAYDAANAIIRTLAAALANLSSPSEARAAVVTALGATAFDGATGPVGFDQFGDTTTPVFTLYRVTDGAWVEVG